MLPIDNSRVERFDVANRPSLTRGRNEFTYYPGMVRIPEGSAPDLKNKSFELRVEVEIPEGGAEGMLVTHGGRFSGYGLYLLDGKLLFHDNYNLAGVARYNIVSEDKVPPGKHTLTADFKNDYSAGGLGKGGAVVLSVDGQSVAVGRVDRTLAFRLSLDETLDVSEDTGTPVSEDYAVPFKFTGALKKVVITPGEEKLSDADRRAIAEARAHWGLSQ